MNFNKDVPFNININNGDDSINDYLYCWSQFKSRPNKYTMHGNYMVNEFINYINTIIVDLPIVSTEVIPAYDDKLVNDRVFSKIGEDIYLSYTHFDKLVDESTIGEVTLFYKNSSRNQLDTIVDNLSNFLLDFSEDDTQGRFFSLVYTQNGFEVEAINLPENKLDNIEYYYNNDVIKKSKKLSKSLKKINKGISIIYGERGTGKTNLLNYITSKVNKSVLYIPSSIIEFSINNPEFKNILKRFKNSIIIIDDSEIHFGQNYIKSSFLINNLIQLVDGYQSDELNLTFLIVLNINDISEMDESILECNNIIDVIEVDYLDLKKSKFLSKNMEIKLLANKPTKLSYFFKKNNYTQDNCEIGYI